MGASNSQIDSDLDPPYNIEKNSKHCSTNFQRLQYHGVRYPKGKRLSVTAKINTAVIEPVGTYLQTCYFL